MPKLIKITGGQPALANDGFIEAIEGEPIPGGDAGVILPLARFEAEGPTLLDQGRRVGVRLKSDEAVEALAYDLPRLSLVALEFPKFRDGRAFSSAALLRQRYGFTGEVRAVGEVLREQAFFMVRCGFDAFEFADDTGPEDLARVAGRYRHVYQTSSDRRRPAFAERSTGAANA
jgi:uncharacterized protein (DUF934 family)